MGIAVQVGAGWALASLRRAMPRNEPRRGVRGSLVAAGGQGHIATHWLRRGEVRSQRVVKVILPHTRCGARFSRGRCGGGAPAQGRAE